MAAKVAAGYCALGFGFSMPHHKLPRYYPPEADALLDQAEELRGRLD